jgi:hypothetical protein
MRQYLGAIVVGLGLLVIGGAPTAHAAIAPRATGPEIATQGLPATPVFWARDRYGRRIWVEPRHYHHHPRGWVDRYGHWHPY